MLSDKTLERVSCSYRQGYRAGSAAVPQQTPETGIARINDDTIGGIIKPFAYFDYDEGYKAGVNDAKWERRDEEKRAAR